MEVLSVLSSHFGSFLSKSCSHRNNRILSLKAILITWTFISALTVI